MLTAVRPIRRRPAPAPVVQAGACRRVASPAEHTSALLPGVDEAARAARSYVRMVLTGRVADVDDAALLVSELVTNALRYTRSSQPGGSIHVSVAVNAMSARVEVRDAGPLDGHVPTLRERCDETGRGLRIVAAYAAAWGWQRCGPGGERTMVWFTLPTEGGS